MKSETRNISMLAKLTFAVTKLKIYMLSAVAPLSFVLVLSWLLDLCFNNPWWLPHFLHSRSVWLRIYALIECASYVLYRMHRERLEKTSPHAKETHSLTDAKVRGKVFHRAIASVNDPRMYFSGWFRGIDFDQIKRDNLKEFVLYAFFEETVDSAAGRHLAEVDSMVDDIEQRFNLKFANGYNNEAKCMRISLDELKVSHKPLVYYLVLGTFNIVFSYYLVHGMGFKKYYSRSEHALMTSYGMDTSKYHNAKVNVTYFYRPAADTTNDAASKQPIVFIHGIGVGLFGYLMFFKKLIVEWDRPIFALHFANISSMIYPLYHTVIEDIPTMEAMVETIDNMFVQHDFLTQKQVEDSSSVVPFATFAGHSFGSMVVSWVLRSRPNYVRRAVFIDPVCFLLHRPDVAHNFVYRTPETTVQLLLHELMSRELYVSWTLHRAFYWNQNNLFLEEIPSHVDVAVILGTNDCIVPTHHVVQYLQSDERALTVDISSITHAPSPKSSSKSYTQGGRIALFVYEMNHAELLFQPHIETQVVQVLHDRVDFDTLTTIAL